jgi:hypothetical protein
LVTYTIVVGAAVVELEVSRVRWSIVFSPWEAETTAAGPRIESRRTTPNAARIIDRRRAFRLSTWCCELIGFVRIILTPLAARPEDKARMSIFDVLDVWQRRVLSVSLLYNKKGLLFKGEREAIWKQFGVDRLTTRHAERPPVGSLQASGSVHGDGPGSVRL